MVSFVRGERATGTMLTALVGFVGLFAVLTRPTASAADVLPTVVGMLVTTAVLWWGSAQSTATPAAHTALDHGSTAETMGLNRRRLFAGVAGIGAASVVVGGVGRLLQANSAIADERADVLLPRPASPAPPLPADVEVGVDGITPFVTPNRDFYRIDTALTVPQVRRDSWRLRVHGMVDRELELSFADLLARDQVERYVTLSCVSNEIGGSLIGTAKWQGVLLADVLREAGLQTGADQVASRSADGWTCGTPTSVIMDGRDAMLAIGMNGEPLPARHGYPVRMVVPGLFGYVSATKWVTEIELTTWDAFDGYWIPKGWSKEGPVKTMARIDRPRRNRGWSTGPLDVAGVAWAIHRGVSAVEVRIDGGDWLECELGDVPSDDTWRQWRYVWDAPPGQHEIEVRAIDGDGVPQPEEPQRVAPDGAQGYHRVRVTIDA
jgi:DMSO/TMAO reductase YedYZ molybdopterin-dependent catalytic subunit